MYKEQQMKQADEEAETDEEMIVYGVKMASKNVRIACKAVKSRDWSIRARIQNYQLSIKRLKEVNRRKRLYQVCLELIQMADFLDGNEANEREMMEATLKSKEKELFNVVCSCKF